MLVRLFCYKCKKYYKANLKDINSIKNHKSQNISFKNETYYYKNGCFFKDVIRLKSEQDS